MSDRRNTKPRGVDGCAAVEGPPIEQGPPRILTRYHGEGGDEVATLRRELAEARALTEKVASAHLTTCQEAIDAEAERDEARVEIGVWKDRALANRDAERAERDRLLRAACGPAPLGIEGVPLSTWRAVAEHILGDDFDANEPWTVAVAKAWDEAQSNFREADETAIGFAQDIDVLTAERDRIAKGLRVALEALEEIAHGGSRAQYDYALEMAKVRVKREQWGQAVGSLEVAVEMAVAKNETARRAIAAIAPPTDTEPGR